MKAVAVATDLMMVSRIAAAPCRPGIVPCFSFSSSTLSESSIVGFASLRCACQTGPS